MATCELNLTDLHGVNVTVVETEDGWRLVIEGEAHLDLTDPAQRQIAQELIDANPGDQAELKVVLPAAPGEAKTKGKTFVRTGSVTSMRVASGWKAFAAMMSAYRPSTAMRVRSPRPREHRARRRRVSSSPRRSRAPGRLADEPPLHELVAASRRGGVA